MLKKIYVVSKTGNLVDTIKRNIITSKTRHMYLVVYKGNLYSVYKLHGKKYLHPPNKNNLRGNAIYPWGMRKKTEKEWAHDIATKSKTVVLT